jgi:hypothetical protein
MNNLFGQVTIIIVLYLELQLYPLETLPLSLDLFIWTIQMIYIWTFTIWMEYLLETKLFWVIPFGIIIIVGIVQASINIC